MTGWEYPLIVALVVVAGVCMAGWRYLLAVVALTIALGFAGARWRYLLAAIVPVTWLVMHLLNYVSDFADRLIYVFDVFWLALFFLAWVAPFLRRWRELAVSCLALGFTFSAFAVALPGPDKGVVLPNRWLQKMGLRIYYSYLITPTQQQELLAKCTFVEYSGEDGAQRKIGECGDGPRSTFYFTVVVVCDPSGEVALPPVERSIPWRLAGRKLPNGPYFIHSEPSGRIDGDLYWIVGGGPLG